MVAPLFILPHIVHLLGTDNLQSGFKCKQIMVAPISILSHIVLYCSPLSLKFPQKKDTQKNTEQKFCIHFIQNA